MKKINIFCENCHANVEYELGTTLLQIAKEGSCTKNVKFPVIGALVNNTVKDLSYELYKPKNIKFIDATSHHGMRMYVHSLCFVLYKAVKNLYPKARLKVEHSISNGLYCRVKGGDLFIDEEKILAIKAEMQRIIDQDIPFERTEVDTEKAIELFEKNNLSEKSELLKTRGNLYTSISSLGDCIDYFYGVLVPSTGYLKVFDLKKYYAGLLLVLPDIFNVDKLAEVTKEDKILRIFSEFKRWGKVLNISNIGDLNRVVENGQISDFIKISEALHEKKLSQIADKINRRKKKLKLILISGPSSSGKTTFANRLEIQLRILGIEPIKISLDDYFVDRVDSPIDENGEYDFESIKSLKVEKFNRDLLALMKGEEIKKIRYSFEKGTSYYNGDTLKMGKKNVLIVEGIHGLNPALTPSIECENKFKIYVSALTTLSIDGHNWIPTTDNRLIRRIVRDSQFRNYSALNTIKRWGSVRKGEEKNIFPFQEEADAMFNTALLYELGVLKNYAEPLLKEIRPNIYEYSEAQRLLKFFSFFKPIADKEIPPTSIMREFLGKSSFSY